MIPGRARASAGLFELVRNEYGLSWDAEPRDCGGVNLNVHLPTTGEGHVVRVYAPWTSSERLAAIQRVRSGLIDAGLPFVPTLATTGGQPFVAFDGRVVEVEPFRSGTNMKIEQLATGMRVLARVHDALRTIDGGGHAREAARPNHVTAELALAWTVQGADAIRHDGAGEDELRMAEAAVELAHALRPLELELSGQLIDQLVHGDFWDNNVLFRRGRAEGAADEVAVLLDLDFMGERPRVDDVALTLYYTNSTLRSEGWGPDVRLAISTDMVRTYDAALGEPLTSEEWAALPLALARTVLCFVGMVPLIEHGPSRRRHVRATAPDVAWSLDIVSNLDPWREAFSAPR